MKASPDTHGSTGSTPYVPPKPQTKQMKMMNSRSSLSSHPPRSLTLRAPGARRAASVVSEESVVQSGVVSSRSCLLVTEATVCHMIQHLRADWMWAPALARRGYPPLARASEAHPPSPFRLPSTRGPGRHAYPNARG